MHRERMAQRCLEIVFKPSGGAGVDRREHVQTLVDSSSRHQSASVLYNGPRLAMRVDGASTLEIKEVDDEV